MGKDMTTAMNFGGIGVVIGHEITHRFDDQGAQWDGDGNLVNWWTEEDKSSFEEKVADNGGVWESKYGLGKSYARSPDKFIPGLSDKFTPDQLFYLGFGQVWCALYRPEYATWMVDN